MNPSNIDDFYYVTSEVLCELYSAFPVRHILLVEDITGPIKWDLTGLPDRKSRACFESLIWLSEHELLNYRSIEPREIGIEGAALTQKGFVLLTGDMTWSDGHTTSRIEALREARINRAYDDLGTIMKDVFRANCHWNARPDVPTLERSPQITVSDEAKAS